MKTEVCFLNKIFVMFILHVLDEKETEQIKARDTELAYYQQLLKEKVSIDPWTPNCAKVYVSNGRMSSCNPCNLDFVLLRQMKWSVADAIKMVS